MVPSVTMSCSKCPVTWKESRNTFLFDLALAFGSDTPYSFLIACWAELVLVAVGNEDGSCTPTLRPGKVVSAPSQV